MGSQSKRKKGTKDNRSIVNDIKRETDQDANRTALQPSFEGLAYSPVGITQTDYVDLTDTIDPLQTNAPPPPAQVTGLNVTVGSNNNTLNLSWTASSTAGIIKYNIYRSTSSGGEILIGFVSASIITYSDNALAAATTYYYKVAAVNDIGVGTLSAEDSATTSGTLPAQITGLSIAVIGNNQLNLSWTASGAAGLINYKIYRSLTSGSEVFLTTSLTNSYSDITVIAGTHYYYKVSAVNDIGEGTLSVEANATTTGTAPTAIPTILLHLDNNVVDSANGVTFNASSSPGSPSGYITPGVFGTHAILINTTGTIPHDFLRSLSGGSPYIQMNTTTGFSISLWIYPTNLSALDERRIVVEHLVDANNKWTLQLRSDGTLMFFVKKGGVDYKRQKGGFVINQWQHIGAVFNASSNTVEVYKDGVAGVASTQATEYPTDPNSSLNFSFRWNETLAHYFEGRIDEFQLFNGTVLTSTQITNLKNTNTA
jgi:hypothetical protein